MWFKNLQLYRFTKPFDLDEETLNKQLAEHSFVPCSSQEPERIGWVSPLGRLGSEMVHVGNGYLMICAKRQQKILPASVVNEALEEKIIAIEDSELRKMPRKERMLLKEEIVFDFMPKAFARSSMIFAYISLRDNLLIINSSSAKGAEELIDNLREALGSLSVIPLTTRNQPIDTMTSWVQSGQVSDDFELGEECELRDNADISCVIRCKNQDLAAAEIVSHLKTGMHVSKLALNWQQRIECVIDENLSIKRLRFSELVQEKASEVEAADALEQFDLDFSIMTLELSEFCKALLSAFGGEDPASDSGSEDAD